MSVNFRLIKEITIAEETGNIYVTTDNNGNQFSLTEMVVIFDDVVATNNGTGGVSVNSGNNPSGTGSNGVFLTIPNLCSTTARKMTAHITVDGGRMFGKAFTAPASFNTYGSANWTSNYNAAGVKECGKIHEFCIGSYNSYKLTSGTITVYGR